MKSQARGPLAHDAPHILADYGWGLWSAGRTGEADAVFAMLATQHPELASVQDCLSVVALAKGDGISVTVGFAGVLVTNKVATNVQAFIDGDGSGPNAGIRASDISLSATDDSGITATVGYRFTRWNQRLATANVITQTPIPISRQLFDLRADVTGPTFTRVFDTPGNGYAARWKHVIQPTFSISKTSRAWAISRPRTTDRSRLRASFSVKSASAIT